METQQSFSIYNKFREEKEKYNKLFEKYGRSYDISISYNKDTNSIKYISNKGLADEEMLTVKYAQDGKIADVFCCVYKEWESLTRLLNNLGSGKFYYDFSSNYNPFSVVTPPHISSYEKEGMFDIMMQTAYEYIKQTGQNVTLGVSYEGYGYACSPVAKIIRGKGMEASCNMDSKTVIYDQDILYVIKYYKDKEKNLRVEEIINQKEQFLEQGEER